MLSLLHLLLQRDLTDPLTSSSYMDHATFRVFHMQANTRQAHVGNLLVFSAVVIEGPARLSLRSFAVCKNRLGVCVVR